MPHKYVDWFTVRPPRTDSLVNLNKLVAACDAMNATHPGGKQTPYAVAKKAGVNVSQAGRLMLRPGFVTVMHKGEPVGVYWDRANFGHKYPPHYVDHTKARVLSEYDITPEEGLGEKAASARQIESVIESATGKVVPILYKAIPTEGSRPVEYRVIFNVFDGGTVEDFSVPIKKFAQEIVDGNEIEANIEAFMKLGLFFQYLHKEKDDA